MSTKDSGPGFILVDSKLNILALNDGAVRILTFGDPTDKGRKMEVAISEKIRSELVNHESRNSLAFRKEFKSGKRRYLCRAFQFRSRTQETPLFGILLERNSSPISNLAEVAEQFDFTVRESQAVELLTQGLTSKEIAQRMQISPNTVKAFLRLVMTKMGVTTRSGIVGRVAGPRT